MPEKFNKQNNSDNTLRLAVCSDLRRNILLSLKSGRKELKVLRDELDASSSTIIHALRDLEKDTLVLQDESKRYALSKIGEVISSKLSDFIDSIDVLKSYEEFWLSHDLRGIPPHLLDKIGCLQSATLLQNPSTDIFQVHTTFLSMLTKAQSIKGISPIFVPQYISLFADLILENKADVELIITEDVLQKIDQKTLHAIAADTDSRFRLYLYEKELHVAFSVTDSFISLGLYQNDGIYDYNRDLVSSDQRAIAWGEELFEWYKKRARRID